MERLVSFGSRILVPFGLKDEPRLGYGIEIAESAPEMDSAKNIIQVLSEHSEITHHEFCFLQFVSFYFFIPISTLMKKAGLFSKSMEPELHYVIQNNSPELFRSFQNKGRIIKFLQHHPDGFSDFQLRRYLKIKKSSLIPRKLTQKGILVKTWKTQKILSFHSIQSENGGKVFLINGFDFLDRLSEYKKRIQENQYQCILFLSPNSWNREKARQWFSDNRIASTVFGSKIDILDLSKPYDLIIIDDSSNQEYQVDQPFPFDLEKVARIRSDELGCTTFLGSFVPSLQSFQDLQSGQVRHISNQTIDKKQEALYTKPLLLIRNMSKEIEKHGFSFIPFTIQKEILRNIKTGKKSLILINRKGFFNLFLCKDCGFTAKCDVCGIPLSYQPSTKKLVCKYCGLSIPEYERCPACNGMSTHYSVYGTEKIEKEARRIFYPESVIRLDSTTVRNRIREEIEASIIIGTSISLDIINFTNVGLCCILGIDSMLNYPHFKSQERVFYFISEIYEKMHSRENTEKRIIVPSFAPFAEIFQSIQSRSIKQVYTQELLTRKQLNHPPYADMIQITLESKVKEQFPAVIGRLLAVLKNMEGFEVISMKPLLGASPFGMYRSEIVLRTSEILNLQDQLSVIIDEFRKNETINVLIRNME